MSIRILFVPLLLIAASAASAAPHSALFQNLRTEAHARRTMIGHGVAAPSADLQAGVLRLSGTVSNLGQMHAAVESLAALPGVQKIEWQSKFSQARKTPQQILTALKQKLIESGFNRQDRLKVGLKDSVLRLRGQVRSPGQISAATKAAYSVPGVTKVINQIQCANASKSAAYIERDVRYRMLWALGHDGVRPTFTEGVLVLKGEVGSLAQQLQIEKLAWDEGVTRIENNTVINLKVPRRHVALAASEKLVALEHFLRWDARFKHAHWKQNGSNLLLVGSVDTTQIPRAILQAGQRIFPKSTVVVQADLRRSRLALAD